MVDSSLYSTSNSPEASDSSSGIGPSVVSASQEPGPSATSTFDSTTRVISDASNSAMAPPSTGHVSATPVSSSPFSDLSTSGLRASESLDPSSDLTTSGLSTTADSLKRTTKTSVLISDLSSSYLHTTEASTDLFYSTFSPTTILPVQSVTVSSANETGTFVNNSMFITMLTDSTSAKESESSQQLSPNTVFSSSAILEEESASTQVMSTSGDILGSLNVSDTFTSVTPLATETNVSVSLVGSLGESEYNSVSSIDLESTFSMSHSSFTLQTMTLQPSSSATATTSSINDTTTQSTNAPHNAAKQRESLAISLSVITGGCVVLVVLCAFFIRCMYSSRNVKTDKDSERVAGPKAEEDTKVHKKRESRTTEFTGSVGGGGVSYNTPLAH